LGGSNRTQGFAPVGARPRTSRSPAYRSLRSLAKNLPLATFLNASPLPPLPGKEKNSFEFFFFAMK